MYVSFLMARGEGVLQEECTEQLKECTEQLSAQSSGPPGDTELLWPILSHSSGHLQMFILMVHGMHSKLLKMLDRKIQTDSTKIFAWPRISKGSQGHLFMCRALAVLLCGSCCSKLSILLLWHQRDKAHRHEVGYGN